MYESMQTEERLSGVPILDCYCQILVKLKEKQMLLENQEAILHYYDILAEHTVHCDPYVSVWFINYTRQFIYLPQEIIPKSLNTAERFGNYLKLISAHGGRTVIGGYMVGNILTSASEFWKASSRVDIYELNRIYGELLREKYSNPLFQFHYGGLGEKTETIPYNRIDGVYGRYAYLDFISDGEVLMFSLDEEMLASKSDSFCDQEKIDLIILCMHNAETEALKGMRNILEKNRPAMMIECGGHFTHQEEYFWNIACLLDNWKLNYRFMTREIYRLGWFLCAIPQERL